MVGSDVPIPGPPPLASASTSTLGNGHTLAPAVGVGGHLPSSSAAVGNGHAATNGFSSSSNGTVTRTTDAMQYDGDEGFVPLWDGSNLDRREFVRLALQAFEDMGYRETAHTLQAESGFALESPAVTQFRQSLLEGRWSDVERHLAELPLEGRIDLTPVHFAIRQQKFLEALEGRETKKALSVLRNELSPLGYDSNRLHFLSSLVMCMSSDDLRARAGWDGASGISRQQLLIHLQDYISPTLMLPQRRLATLLSQAQSHQQRHHALAPAASEPFSLLVDADPHGSTGFPTMTTHVLQEHTDEVWRLEWSHNGEWLATAGKDRTAMIWNVKAGFALDKVFREHTDPVSCLAWSPDDSILLTAADATIKMWNTESGSCIATLTRHEYAIGALAWLPDGRGFVSGGMDSRIFFWDLSGNVISHLARCPSRIIDLAISPDGSKLVCIGRADTTEPHLLPPSRSSAARSAASSSPAHLAAQALAAAGAGGIGGLGLGNALAGPPPLGARHEKRISVFKLAKGASAAAGGDSELLYEVIQPNELTSVAISSDSRHAIVNHAPRETLLLNLNDGTIVRRFDGHHMSHFVVRACFGGSSENFVLSGSSDGKVHVYHRDTGQILHVLTGHAPTTVNAVAWNARPPVEGARGAMWASCADDRTVRVWQMSPDVLEHEQDRRRPRLVPLDRRG
ncbi:uncharacterized protein JCM10292_002643 [Rhodotorula paludigena]|uniref:uncharacterized protein n=1 Tax=Rhodotorula paludigena TaxID=86838 RepID=UPI00317284F6